MRIAVLLLAVVAYPRVWAQSDLFISKVYPALEASGCRNCHSADGVASPTRLRFPVADSSPARIAAFGKSLAILVDRSHPDRSSLILKPTKRIAHSGGERIKQGSVDEGLLLQWANVIAKLSDAEVSAALAVRDTVVATATPKLRRLTHTQYNNTVRDLLGDASLPANQFPPEDFVNGFRNQTQAQSVSPLLAEAYSAAAEKLARTAFRGGDTNNLIPCKPSPDCAAQFITSFGRKAFRRPVTEAEKRRYQKLFASEKNFLNGAQLVVEAMLQAPGFLLRREDSKDAFAIANRLSYFLWDSMPDAALFDDAASGRLSSQDGIEKAANRLLADTKAHQALDEFVSQWLRFDRVITSVKDRRVFANFNRETAISMTEETRRFIADLVWNNRDFMGLFTANYGFLNDDLATIYKAPKPAEEFGRVEFPASEERAGILGQATFLSLTSKPDDTSPTARGLFVREQFLCQHVPEPPPGVAANLPPVAETKPMSNRDRLGVHLSNASCASCHTLVDPIGFGFEKFDAVGARRERLKIAFAPGRKEKKETTYAEVDLDTKGWVAGVENSAFSNPRELGVILARTPQCQECIVKQLFRWAAGRLETPADDVVLKRALDDFRTSQFSFKQLMISLAKRMDNGQRNHKTD